jgi:DNA-binding transcriptional ArsR family regulator
VTNDEAADVLRSIPALPDLKPTDRAALALVAGLCIDNPDGVTPGQIGAASGGSAAFGRQLRALADMGLLTARTEGACKVYAVSVRAIVSAANEARARKIGIIEQLHRKKIEADRLAAIAANDARQRLAAEQALAEAAVPA